MKRAKLKEWKKSKPEGVLLPWIPHFPKILSILKTQDTRSHSQRRRPPLQLSRKKRNKNQRMKKKIMENHPKSPSTEVQKHTMISEQRTQRSKMLMVKRMMTIKTTSNAGITRKPTSTNKKKTKMVKLKTSISKRKEAKMIEEILKRIKNLKSPTSLERTSSRKTTSKMTKTTTDTTKIEEIENMVDTDKRSPTTTYLKRVEMNIEDQEATKVIMTEMVAKGTNGTISNPTHTEAMTTSM